MPEQNLFEYAIVRIVPQVEREEFINAGVILYCGKKQFLKARFHIDSDRIKKFPADFNCIEIKEYLDAIERVCAGDSEAGAIGRLSIAERFRWLTATRSTVLQTSKVHPGICDDPGQTLDKIFTQLVL